jgi:hypothetical protein
VEILEALLEPLAEAILEGLLMALVAALAELVASGPWERERKLQTLFGNEAWWNS